MNERKRLSGLGIVGSIINIIFGINIIIVSIYTLFVYLNNMNSSYRDILINGEIIIPISATMICSLFGFLSIIKNGNLLSGNLSKKFSAILFGFLTLSILGSIFIMSSSIVVKVEKVKLKIIERELNCNEMINILLNYKSLLDTNVINEEEYQIIKNKILKL